MAGPGIVDADLIAACKATIDAEFGAIPAGLGVDADAFRQKLAICIAKAAQYVRDNGVVVVGQQVIPDALLDSLGHPVTGTGTVDTEGSLR